ncbi:MAG TPA: capsular biosynthesis protein, partial [Clostridiales bacterium]|nr:capsular biosynthesis protein [Clostridiales bacterium]
MNILVTGAKGFVGRNLVAALENIRDGKDRTRGMNPDIDIFAYDLDTDPALLDGFCRDADFVFHLAGVNRPEKEEDFMRGNFGFTSTLLDTLKKYHNRAPVMISSSIQARLDNPYGNSKRAGEDLVFSYGKETGTKVLVYRFPNLFGKWCRPNYNSVIATFCYNLSRDLPIRVNDPSVTLELLYIDDLIDEMISALKGEEHTAHEDGRIYAQVPVTHRVTLGEVVSLLTSFTEQPKTLMMPKIPAGSFEKKLYSTYLSYLPPEKTAFPPKTNVDLRGSFTELLKTENCGQFSVNISRPGITKGQHWHNTKWELFIVVSGRGLIQQRKIGTEEVLNF